MALLAIHPPIGGAIIAGLAWMTLHHRLVDQGLGSRQRRWIETQQLVQCLTRRSTCPSDLTSPGGGSQSQERTCWRTSSKNSSVEAGWVGDCLGTLLMVFWGGHVVEVGAGRQLAAVDGAGDGLLSLAWDMN
jgi:hypothetical protein